MSMVLLAGLLLSTQPQHHHDPQHSFEDIDRWVEAFESPERDARQKPDEVVAAMKLAKGDAVVDIGAGTGYFTRRFADAVGENGVVYAVDIEPNMLRYIGTRALKDGQHNIVPVLGGDQSPMLPPDSIDVAFICNTIHHIQNRDVYYAALERALRPGGRFVVVDFYKDAELDEGPSREMRLRKTRVVEELADAGFELVREEDFLPVQYMLIFEAP